MDHYNSTQETVCFQYSPPTDQYHISDVAKQR